MDKPFRAWTAGLLTALALPVAAGQVEVKFIDSQRYADAGTTRPDEQRNLDTLSAFFKVLGARYLPPDRTLVIEVTDVDLAGEPRPSRRGEQIRIVRGSADWPRITLRYRLVDGSGQALRQGEERVADPAYTQHTWDKGDSDPLRYEKRMLDDWFRRTFPAASPR